MIELHVLPSDRYVLVLASGELDERAIPTFRHDLLAVIGEHLVDVVLDVTELSGVGVHGQAVLVGLRMRLRARGRHLVLVTAARSGPRFGESDASGGVDGMFRRRTLSGAELLLSGLTPARSPTRDR